MLKSYSKEVQWKNLSNIDLKVSQNKQTLKAKLQAKSLAVEVDYGLESTRLKGLVRVGGMKASITGNTKEELRITSNISSVPKMMKDISSFYALGDIPNIQGKINTTIKVKKMSKIDLKLSAPKLIYKADKKTKQTLKDLKVALTFEENKLVLKSYNVLYKKQKFKNSMMI